MDGKKGPLRNCLCRKVHIYSLDSLISSIRRRFLNYKLDYLGLKGKYVHYWVAFTFSSCLWPWNCTPEWMLQIRVVSIESLKDVIFHNLPLYVAAMVFIYMEFFNKITMKITVLIAKFLLLWKCKSPGECIDYMVLLPLIIV